jgi:hypothetical protein
MGYDRGASTSGPLLLIGAAQKTTQQNMESFTWDSFIGNHE